MNYHKHIFNQKTLNIVLSRIGASSEPNLKEKQEIISKWIQFLQSGKLDNIKETSIDQKFLDDFFVSVLGYQGVIGGSEAWNMIPQQKMKVTTNRADGALGYFSNEQEDIRAVIELKDANTDLDSPQHRRNDKRTPVQQAFGYAPEAGKSCKWVIVSNFKELRLYHRSALNEYEVFFIKKLLEPETFKKFYYLLSKENLIAKDGESEIEKLYRNNTEEEERISNKFYGEYKAARIHLFEHLKENNPDKDELLLLEKTQKILDRFIFVCFCEDKGLLPERTFRDTLEQARNVIIELEYKNWVFIQGLFKAINDGKREHDINKFNGGLFAPDDELDTLKLNDAVFEELAKITDYDFDTDLNVNILGHIFEQSISDLEEIKAEINGERLDKKKGKRKKEGIYYTPEYITRYIVENAIGGWLEDRKKELGFYDLPELTEKDYESVKVKKRAYNDNIKRHLDFWEAYKSILENIKVLDPACGSGAFLNQAFDYLYREGQRVNEEIAKLKRGTYSLVDLDKSILSDNLYGVDLNSESVEITKLSLWLKTASKHKELTALDENIKCGNSLIEDSEIAGEKAFKWEAEFTQIMQSGGFDVVICNPPYVDNRGFDKNQLNYFFNKYVSFTSAGTKKYKTKKFNTFVAFIEILKNIMKPKGVSGYIVHKNLLKTTTYKGVRNFILQNFKIKKIVDWGADQFKDVIAETISLILEKDVVKDNVVEIEFFNKNMREKQNNTNQKSYKKNIDYIFSINLNETDYKILNKIDEIEDKLFDFVNINNGIVTGDDKKFISSERINDNYKICVTGKNIKRYLIPEFKGYLNYDRNTLMRPRNKDIFEADEKLLMQMININFVLAYDDSQSYNLGTTYAITKNKKDTNLKYILALLNSKLITYYYIKKFTNESILTNAISTKNLFEIPLPNIPPSQQYIFIGKADRMIDLNKQFHHNQKEFLDWLKINYGLEKQSKKLESFYELDEEAFFAELKKKLPKENKNISPKQTGEIKLYFEDYQQKIIALKNEIEQTDKEIDEMVYELYGLTKEEIKIIKP